MKKLICISVAVLFTASVYAQAPQKMSYQAVIRNSSNALITNKTIGMKISILQGTSTGTPVYVETQLPTTNANGLASLEIGGGTVVSGIFATINWANGPYFIKTETDPAGGTNYTIIGTSQLMSVPYALHAKTADSIKGGITETDPIFGSSIAKGITGIDTTNWNNKQNKLTAGSGVKITNNVISTNMSIQASNFGDTLFLVPGNYVIIPGVSSINSAQPYVTTSVITTITSNSAKCGYTVTMSGSPAINERGVCWDTLPLPGIGGYRTLDGTITGTLTSNITGLTPNKTYYVRAYATNSNDTYYSPGDGLMFTTTPTLPTLTTADTSLVTETTATTGGNVTYSGGADVTVRGVCWNTSQSPTAKNNRTSDGTGNGAFTSVITGLTSNKLYYIRAYAINTAADTGYGQQLSFTTDCALPTVFTDTILSVTPTSASGIGYITSEGSSAVTERGICWNTSPNPTIYNYKTIVAGGIGSFTGSRTLLVPNTTYYIRAYATNSCGTSYGVNKSFTTSNSYYEGFESGFPSTWSGIGWGVTTLVTSCEGYSCLRAAQLNDSIWFTRTVTTSPNGSISFYYQTDNYPWGNQTSFYIDNVLQATFSDENCALHSYTFPTGTHTFKWKMVKKDGGDDTFIDYIIVSP